MHHHPDAPALNMYRNKLGQLPDGPFSELLSSKARSASYHTHIAQRARQRRRVAQGVHTVLSRYAPEIGDRTASALARKGGERHHGAMMSCDHILLGGWQLS